MMNGHEEHLALINSYCDIAEQAASVWKSADGSVATVLTVFQQRNGGPAGATALVLKPTDVDILVTILRRIKLRTSGLVRQGIPILPSTINCAHT